MVEFGSRSKESKFLAIFWLVEGTLGIGLK